MTTQRTRFSPDIAATHDGKIVSILGSSGVYRKQLKRLIDIVLVILAAPVVLPVIVLLCVMIVLRDGGNPFYAQSRVGRHGRIFRMWKLRSMVKDADRRLEHYLRDNPEARLEWDEKQKLTSDPRITSIGRVLRRTSLDELPQLWNVFCGDMSLVGPRPMMPNQRSIYPGFTYYALRPGLTGYWQISERHESGFAARSQFDSRYFEDMSLTTDMSILKATVGVVFRGTGC